MSISTNLAEELAAYKEGYRQRVGPERVAMMEAATAELRATGIESRALQVGAMAPSLSLPDATHRQVALRELWQAGPLVVIFYRGGWCPYCNLELRAWQRELAALRGQGGTLVAISPQTPDNSLTTAEKNELAFPVLSDTGLVAAEAFGVSFVLSPELIALYSSVGNDLPTVNGNGRWALPLPATFVIGREGRITFAHVEADYRSRAEPSAVMDAVRRASKAAGAGR